MATPDKIIIQLRRSVLYALAVFVVTTAVALSIARVFLPQVQSYKDGIEQKLGELIEQNVRIDTIDARLIGLTPTIIFKGVHLIDDSGVKELISFKEAHLGIAVLESFSQRTLVPSDFSIVGTVISVLQNQNGNFSIQGVDISGLDKTDSKISEELANWLMQQASISLKDGSVVLKLKKDDKWRRFEKVNLTLHNRYDRHQLSASFQMPQNMGKHSKLAMDVTGNLLEPQNWHGLVYIASDGLELSRLGISPEFKGLEIRDGVADFALWGEWFNGGFKQLSGDIAIEGAEILNKKFGKTSKVDQLKGKFDWQGSLSDWKLRLDGLEFARQGSVWKESAITASWKQTGQKSSELGFSMAYAKIEDVRQLLIESGLYNGKGLDMLKAMNPVGEVSNLIVHFIRQADGKQKYRLTGNVKQLGIRATASNPGFYGLNADINFDESHGKMAIAGKNVIFSKPELFRQSIVLDRLAGNIELLNTGNGWVFQGKDFVATNDDMKISLGMMLLLPQNKKSHYLDLQLAVRELDITQVYKYQPSVLMKEKLVKWIDTAFKNGRVPEVNLVYRGWSKQFPFRQYGGVLNGDFHAVNVDMDYFPKWPGLEGLEANGEFTNKSMTVKSVKASIHGGEIKDLVVKIDDFKKPILVATGDAYSTTHDGFNFFSKTPVGKRSQRFVSKTRFAGDIHTNMTFSVALDKELAKRYKKRFSGFVETDNSEMYLMHQRLDVTDIKGRVYFSSKKHHGEGITAKLLEGKTKITVSSKIVGVKPVMEIMGEGDFDAVMLDRRFGKLGLMRVNGRVPWKGKLTLSHLKANGEGRNPAKMWIKTDLVGVGIDLPEPFKKSPETARPTVIRSTFLPEIKTILNVQYGDRMSTEMRLNNNYFPARIEIGEMKLSAGKAKLPEKDEFRISGVVNNMDQYTWREVMQQHYNKYHKLRSRPIVDVPVIVDFAYINVPFDKTKAKPRKRYTSPIVMPAFKGVVRNFVFAGKEIGKVEFDSRRDKFGLAFDNIKLTSPYMKYQGKLTWHYLNNWHKTKVQGKLTTTNLGKVMEGFGFPDKVEEGEGEISLDLNWDNPFYVFRPGYTNGKIKLALEDGVVTAINPGAGRFLGLLNISNLPRRLLLDFKDAGSGFAFDTLTGMINLKDGVAKTDDLAVDSTVADILAVGKVDLRNKEFDQIVTVTPQVAGTMPVVSGLLMGTGVIPLVWLFERMFGSDMDKSLSRQYHISGPWKKPKVERIDKEEKSDGVS